MPKNGITPACAGNSCFWMCPCKLWKDHPRVCGEQSPISMAFCVGMGSPPRVRGTGVFRPGYLGGHGITPACAGNREASVTNGGTEKDHPRVCGEQNNNIFYYLPFIGSPPRVRGTAIVSEGMELCMRITPACAGNSRGA